MIGFILLVTLLIAGGIAGYTGRGADASFGQFAGRFIVAWILVVLTLALVAYAAFVVMLGSGCVNC